MISNSILPAKYHGFSASAISIPPIPWYTGWDYAYQPKGAASLAASYTNLVTPGVGDLPGTGMPPTWTNLMGWSFNGTTQYLKTGIIPAAGWSAIALLIGAQQSAKIVFGSLGAGATAFYIFPYRTAANLQYGNGGILAVAPYLLTGCLGIAGQRGYRNGVADGAALGAWAGAGVEIYIGALNNNGVLSLNDIVDVQAIAFADSVVSPADMLTTYNRMLSQVLGGALSLLVGFGDSITAGTGATAAANRWLNIVANTKGWMFYNAGLGSTVLQNTVQNTVAVIGGAATNNGRDAYSTRVIPYLPTRVLILYGLNDVRLNDVAFTAALYQNDLGEVIDGLTAAGISAANIVIGSPPYIPAASYALYGPQWNGGSAPDHAAHVAAAAAVAAAKGTKYVDVYQWMSDNGGDALIGADNIHPNDAGHAAIAAAFLSVL